MAASILARRDRISLDNGFDLRLLSALEVVQARREAEELTEQDGERELWVNACLLARALEKTEDQAPVFSGGQGVMAALTVEEITALADRWSAFSQESTPELWGDSEESPKRDGPPPEEWDEPDRPRAERGTEEESPAGAAPEAVREEYPEERLQPPAEELKERPVPDGAPAENPAEERGRPEMEPAFFHPEKERGQEEGEVFPLPLRPVEPEEVSALAPSGPEGWQTGLRRSARAADELNWAEQADRIFRRDSRRYDGGFYLY